ncbi:hypothetical protein OAM67_01850 [bacterium]|nr:hypothetical protein [bacterium]
MTSATRTRVIGQIAGTYVQLIKVDASISFLKLATKLRPNKIVWVEFENGFHQARLVRKAKTQWTFDWLDGGGEDVAKPEQLFEIQHADGYFGMVSKSGAKGLVAVDNLLDYASTEITLLPLKSPRTPKTFPRDELFVPAVPTASVSTCDSAEHWIVPVRWFNPTPRRTDCPRSRKKATSLHIDYENGGLMRHGPKKKCKTFVPFQHMTGWAHLKPNVQWLTGSYFARTCAADALERVIDGPRLLQEAEQHVAQIRNVTLAPIAAKYGVWGLVAKRTMPKDELVALYLIRNKRNGDEEVRDGMYTIGNPKNRKLFGDVCEESVPPPTVAGVPFWGHFANEPSPGEHANCKIYTLHQSSKLGGYTLLGLYATHPILIGEECMWCYGETYDGNRPYPTGCVDQHNLPANFLDRQQYLQSAAQDVQSVVKQCDRILHSQPPQAVGKALMTALEGIREPVKYFQASLASFDKHKHLLDFFHGVFSKIDIFDRVWVCLNIPEVHKLQVGLPLHKKEFWNTITKHQLQRQKCWAQLVKTSDLKQIGACLKIIVENFESTCCVQRVLRAL